MSKMFQKAFSFLLKRSMLVIALTIVIWAAWNDLTGFAISKQLYSVNIQSLDSNLKKKSNVALIRSIQRTGQKIKYRTGDDGDEKKGIVWPSPRFTDNSNGTITDILTGLVWLKEANYRSTTGEKGRVTWNEAVDFCKSLQSNQCGLTDQSKAGDWRLPNLFELESLRDMAYLDPSLSDTSGTSQWQKGDPFFLLSGGYWSSTTSSHDPSCAWDVFISKGSVNALDKGIHRLAWPVRDKESNIASIISIQRTGQKIKYRTGDDGDEKKGMGLPFPRFTDNSNGTVTDNLTGLVWLKRANYRSAKGETGPAPWNEAVDFCKSLQSGQCGLTDQSKTGDWRLPNLFELESLRNMAYHSPCLSDTSGTSKWSAGDPFLLEPDGSYWTSTSFRFLKPINGGGIRLEAWTVRMFGGESNVVEINEEQYVWPVRDYQPEPGSDQANKLGNE